MKIGILIKTANSIYKDNTKNILNDTAAYDAVLVRRMMKVLNILNKVKINIFAKNQIICYNSS